MFLVGEPVDHMGMSGQGRYDCHRIIDGKFVVSSRPITVSEFNDFASTQYE